jgi:hypothetical protein
MAILAIAVPAGPASAQETDPLKMKYERERKERQAIEKQYDETMKHMRSQGSTAPTDPWRKVRPASSETNAKR